MQQKSTEHHACIRPGSSHHNAQALAGFDAHAWSIPPDCAAASIPPRSFSSIFLWCGPSGFVPCSTRSASACAAPVASRVATCLNIRDPVFVPLWREQDRSAYASWHPRGGSHTACMASVFEHEHTATKSTVQTHQAPCCMTSAFQSIQNWTSLYHGLKKSVLEFLLTGKILL